MSLQEPSPSHLERHFPKSSESSQILECLEPLRKFPPGTNVKGQGRNEKCTWQRMQALGVNNQRPKVTERIPNGSLRHWKVDTNCGEIKIPVDGEVQ